MFTHLRVVVPGTGHPVGVPYFPGAKNYAYLKVLLPDNEWLSVPGAKGFTHLGVSRLGTRIMLPMLLTRLPVLPCGVGLRTHIRHRFTYGDLRIIFSIGGLESACRSGVCLAVWSLLAGLESAWRSGVCLPMSGAHQSRLASFITFGAREKTAIIFGKAIRAKARSIRLTATSRVMTLARTIVAT